MKFVPRLIALLLLLLPVSRLLAQQTGLTGTVLDTQGAVIPNAVVEVKREGAAAFHTKSNGEGIWIVPSLVAGDYIVTITADGFDTVKKKVSMLVGQTPQVDVSLPLAGSQQQIVVNADTVAVDTTASAVGGNVTPSEVQDTPINGRNYMALSTLVPGVHINAITSDVPVGSASESGKFQITLDGLQISQDTAGAAFGQPRISQDAIAQFQIITNRFDATLGRSGGVYVNSQTKSGTNSFHGGAFGYFRNDALNAADPVTHAVLPFKDSQYGGTLGGPIRKDKFWFFGSYEGEYRPATATSIAFGSGSTSHADNLKVNEYLGRGDYQFNEKNHLLLRGDGFTYKDDFLGVTGVADPSRAYIGTRTSYGYVADWNSNLTPHLVNDLRAGFHHFGWQNQPYVQSIEIIFPNTTVGGAYNYPQVFAQDTQQYRDDLFWLKGKHSVKAGAEFLYTAHGGFFQQNVRGRVTPCGASPTTAQFAAMFPNGTSDPASWNYTQINAVCNSGTGLTFTQGFGNFTVNVPRSIFGFWFQDDWKLSSRLTVNLGFRYDNDLGAFTGGPKLSNGLLVPGGNDNNNFAPRIGFALDPTGHGKTSIRGGIGLYYADISANQIIDQQIFNGVSTIQASVSGSTAGANPVNLANPFNGGNPAANPAAYTQAVQPLSKDAKVPYSMQASFGAQHEFPGHFMVSADLVHTRVYRDWTRFQGNLLVDPTNPQRNLSSSANITSSTTRVCGNGSVALDTPTTVTYKAVCNQSFTQVQQFFTPNGAGSIYDGLHLAVKRTGAKFNAGLAYTASRTKNSTEGPFYYPNKPFINGLGSEWGNGTDDQRHSLTVNGEYKFKYGLSLSSLYRFGSGMAFATSTGTSAPNGGTPTANRTVGAGLVPTAAGSTCTGTTVFCTYAPTSHYYFDSAYGYYILNRNSFRGTPFHRMDVRLQEAIPIHEKYKAILGVEVFNILNHANYASFTTVANNANYGRPASAQGTALEYAARQIQFLARFSF